MKTAQLNQKIWLIAFLFGFAFIKPTLAQQPIDNALESLKQNYTVIGVYFGPYIDDYHKPEFPETIAIVYDEYNYYMAFLSNNTFEVDDEDYVLRKMTQSSFRTIRPNDDMPEKFVLTNKGIDTCIYNPDYGDWVFMGYFKSLYF